MKIRHALYYSGMAAASEAKARADEIRKEKGSAIVLDADAWMGDKESVDTVEFFGVSKDRQEAIEAKYADLPEVPTEEPIPENWEELSFSELQAIATRISNEPVRSKGEAEEIIRNHLDKPKADEPAPVEVKKTRSRRK